MAVSGTDVGAPPTEVWPLISVIIPCRNEQRYIRVCLDSVLASTYPKDSLEVLVVDGMSDDGTRDTLLDYASHCRFIKVLDNPQRRIPQALNIGIAHAQGEIIVRLDAHARYDVDYLAKSVAYLEKYSADNVGGVRATEPQEETLIGKAIAFSVSSPFTAGNALFRVGSQRARWVDTVFGGCFRKELFQRIGLFNEELTRAEDREFNQRLRDAGGRILLSPDIRCTYYARSKLQEFIRWIVAGSSWVFFGGRVAGRRLLAFRNYVPLAFVLSLLVSLITACFQPWVWWVLGTIVFFYLLANIVSALPLVRKERDARYLLAAPLIFTLTHFLYAVGSVYGIWKAIVNTSPRCEC